MIKRHTFFISWSGVESRPLLLRLLNGPPYQHRAMMNDDECEALHAMLGRGNRSPRTKPAPMPNCPPLIPHKLTGLEPGPLR
jgi:hypothetical protein